MVQRVDKCPEKCYILTGRGPLKKTNMRYICAEVSASDEKLHDVVRRMNATLRKATVGTTLLMVDKHYYRLDRYSKSVKTVAVPVLFNYVFVRTNKTRYGLMRLFKDEGLSIRLLARFLSDKEVAWLLKLLSDGSKPVRLKVRTHVEVGDKVKVTMGPYKGADATVESRRGDLFIIRLGSLRLEASKNSVRRLDESSEGDTGIPYRR